MGEKIDIQNYVIKKAIKEQLGEDFASDNELDKSLQEAQERNNLLLQSMINKSNKLKDQGKEPYPCFNTVCPDNLNLTNSCRKNVLCHDCLFQMLTSPPNSLDYSMNEKMPSHQEALDLLVENGLLKDDSWEHQLETIYFRDTKKPATQYDRAEQEIKNITMDHLRVIILNFLEECYNKHKTIFGNFEFEPNTPDFDFTNEEDREIFARNICIGIEKVMGIYPNIQKLR